MSSRDAMIGRKSEASRASTLIRDVHKRSMSNYRPLRESGRAAESSDGCVVRMTAHPYPKV